MIFFTSDHHFGHGNIIKWCNRPFESVEEMDAEMIKRWNEVVAPDDTVYHLGDFHLGKSPWHYFEALNGSIRLLAIHWHHDRRWIRAIDSNLSWDTKTGYMVCLGPETVIEIDGQQIHLSHYPLGEWDKKHYGAWHLHGHSHGNYIGDDWRNKCMDVGVDTWNFTPVSYLELKEKFES